MQFTTGYQLDTNNDTDFKILKQIKKVKIITNEFKIKKAIIKK